MATTNKSSPLYRFIASDFDHYFKCGLWSFGAAVVLLCALGAFVPAALVASGYLTRTACVLIMLSVPACLVIGIMLLLFKR